jgi:t-SNARE complex subunit (syntaxin)
MKSFINYLLMLEAKVDDLASKHPEHADAIHKYNSADPTPTKKFLPWLVKQHISGHVTPDDARLHSTLKNFDKVKHGLTTKDHTGYKHFNDLAKSVEGRVKTKMKAEGKKNAVDTIHTESDTGITAHHIKTKEASQELYGGGNERGGKKGCARGTSWCVSARSEGNLFHNYGHMYTIHDPHDDNAPYAVHPFNSGGTVTSRHNDGEHHYGVVVKRNPKIKKAVDAIMDHSAKHIGKVLDDKDPVARKRAIEHPKATPEHIDKAINDEKFTVRQAAIKHPKATTEHIDRALNDEEPSVREQAVRHPKATTEHISKALNDKAAQVRREAIQHPKATTEHISKALNDKDDFVRGFAVKHPKATPEHITKALNDKDVMVRREAIQHPKATTEHIDKALNDEERSVRQEAIRHPKVTDDHISKALNDEDEFVRQEAKRVRRDKREKEQS